MWAAFCVFWFVRPYPYYTPEGIVDLHSGICVGRELYPNFDILMLGQSLSQQANPYGSDDSFALFEGVRFSIWREEEQRRELDADLETIFGPTWDW